MSSLLLPSFLHTHAASFSFSITHSLKSVLSPQTLLLEIKLSLTLSCSCFSSPPPYALQAVCWAWTLRLRRYESVHLSPRWTSRMYRTWKAAGKKIQTKASDKSEWQKDTTLKCKVGPLVDLTSSCELSNLNFTSQLFKSTPNPLTLLGSTFVRLPVFYPPS